ncbi:MAG: inner membrane CreD family protein [Janthinobacterium lividum]
MSVGGHAMPLPVASSGDVCGSAATVSPGLAGPPASGTAIPFATRLSLRGTQSFAVAPWGSRTDLAVEAPWQTPASTAPRCHYRTRSATWASTPTGRSGAMPWPAPSAPAPPRCRPAASPEARRTSAWTCWKRCPPT